MSPHCYRYCRKDVFILFCNIWFFKHKQSSTERKKLGMKLDESGQKMDKSGWKWMKVDKMGWNGIKMGESAWKWMKVVESGWKWSERIQDGPKLAIIQQLFNNYSTKKRSKCLTLLTISKYCSFPLFLFLFFLFKSFQIDHGAISPSLMVLLKSLSSGWALFLERQQNNACTAKFSKVHTYFSLLERKWPFFCFYSKWKLKKRKWGLKVNSVMGSIKKRKYMWMKNWKKWKWGLKVWQCNGISESNQYVRWWRGLGNPDCHIHLSPAQKITS